MNVQNMIMLDMRGHPCPVPVVNAKKALAEQSKEGVIVLVDNIVAVQNLEKMAKGYGCAFSYEEEGANYRVNITKGADFKQPAESSQGATPSEAQGSMAKDSKGFGSVVLIGSDCMGKGEAELGKILIKGFIFSLTQLNPPPEAVIFLNSGVHLAMEGSNTVPDLKELEKKGSCVFVCGTCANYYKLTESLAVGSIVDMMFITEKLAKASGIIPIF